MKAKTIFTYKFSELSEEVQTRIAAEHFYDIYNKCVEMINEEYQGFIDTLELKYPLEIIIRNKYDYDVRFTKDPMICLGADEIRGKLAWRYIRDTFVSDFICQKRYAKGCTTRLSHISHVYNYYTYTGMYTDFRFVKALVYYYENGVNDDTSLQDIIEEVIGEVVEDYRLHIEYYESYDSVIEYLSENDENDYTLDGTMV